MHVQHLQVVRKSEGLAGITILGADGRSLPRLAKADAMSRMILGPPPVVQSIVELMAEARRRKLERLSIVRAQASDVLGDEQHDRIRLEAFQLEDFAGVIQPLHRKELEVITQSTVKRVASELCALQEHAVRGCESFGRQELARTTVFVTALHGVLDIYCDCDTESLTLLLTDRTLRSRVNGAARTITRALRRWWQSQQKTHTSILETQWRRQMRLAEVATNLYCGNRDRAIIRARRVVLADAIATKRATAQSFGEQLTLMKRGMLQDYYGEKLTEIDKAEGHERLNILFTDEAFLRKALIDALNSTVATASFDHHAHLTRDLFQTSVAVMSREHLLVLETVERNAQESAALDTLHVFHGGRSPTEILRAIDSLQVWFRYMLTRRRRGLAAVARKESVQRFDAASDIQRIWRGTTARRHATKKKFLVGESLQRGVVTATAFTEFEALFRKEIVNCELLAFVYKLSPTSLFCSLAADEERIRTTISLDESTEILQASRAFSCNRRVLSSILPVWKGFKIRHQLGAIHAVLVGEGKLRSKLAREPGTERQSLFTHFLQGLEVYDRMLLDLRACQVIEEYSRVFASAKALTAAQGLFKAVTRVRSAGKGAHARRLLGIRRNFFAHADRSRFFLIAEELLERYDISSSFELDLLYVDGCQQRRRLWASLRSATVGSMQRLQEDESSLREELQRMVDQWLQFAEVQHTSIVTLITTTVALVEKISSRPSSALAAGQDSRPSSASSLAIAFEREEEDFIATRDEIWREWQREWQELVQCHKLSSAEITTDIVSRIRVMYRAYAPEKEENIPGLLSKYKGSEYSLLTAIVRKYGVEPREKYILEIVASEHAARQIVEGAEESERQPLMSARQQELEKHKSTVHPHIAEDSYSTDEFVAEPETNVPKSPPPQQAREEEDFSIESTSEDATPKPTPEQLLCSLASEETVAREAFYLRAFPALCDFFSTAVMAQEAVRRKDLLRNRSDEFSIIGVEYVLGLDFAERKLIVRNRTQDLRDWLAFLRIGVAELNERQQIVDSLPSAGTYSQLLEMAEFIRDFLAWEADPNRKQKPELTSTTDYSTDNNDSEISSMGSVESLLWV